MGMDLFRRLADSAEGTLRAEFLLARSALTRQLGYLEQATADLDAAVKILDVAEADGDASQSMILAGALCNRGNVHCQRSAYHESLADYERAVAIIERLSDDDSSTKIHLATLFVNRGNLLRELVRTREAIRDYTRAIQIHCCVFEPNLQAVDAALALAFLNRGNALADLWENEAALEDYSAAMNIYSCLIQSGQTEFRHQLGYLHVLRGTALEARGEVAKALDAFDEGIPIIREFVAAGRADLEHLLALAIMNRSATYHQLRRADDALLESDIAADRFRRLVETGRRDLEGFLAHALLNGAWIRYETGHALAGDEWLSRGRRIARVLIRGNHPEMLVVYIRYLAFIALAIVADRPTESVTLLEEAFDEFEKALQEEAKPETLTLAFNRTMQRIDAVVSTLRSHGFDSDRYTRVRGFFTAR
jgi:tetratricopeptide (TPR) repeat protein